MRRRNAITKISTVLVSLFSFFALSNVVSAACTAPGSGPLWDFAGQGGVDGADLPCSSILSIVSQTMLWILSILGFLAIIGFVISGILYLTSAGDDKRAATAKAAMTASIMGVIVALIGAVIVYAVTDWLDASTSF